MKYNLLLVGLICLSCNQNKLPILGQFKEINGQKMYPQTPEFSLMNQEGKLITRSQLEHKIHIANFFFTSCATICPKTIRSMIRIAKHFEGNDQIQYLNFSIDYRKDSVPRLKTYYDRMQVHIPDFNLLHIPNMVEVKRITENYMSIAVEDPEAQGGFDHSGWILLADKNLYLRSFCLGTDDKEVDRFIEDIETLLNEN